MKVLVTGAAGYLGRGLVIPFEGRCDLRLMDVTDFDTPHEKVVGSVADLDAVQRAMDGVDALVIAHMASRQAGSYEAPPAAYAANVTGTANLFHVAAARGLKRVALISSIGVVQYYQNRGEFLTADLPLRGDGIYSHTKICQEIIARQYHWEHGIGVAAIRPAYITDMDTARDKYGRQATECNWQFVDRRDIGEIARRALLLPDLGFEVFWALSTPMAARHADMEPTCRRLDWKPAYDFSNLKQDPR
ncbi:MAG: NAD(P)-dependent oxidoreductase [Gemmatimonadota bacterium]